MPRPRLIVIADDRGRSTLPKRITSGSVAIIDCQNIDALSSVGNDPVLIDVDLHDISKVKVLKENLPARIYNQCRIIAVDRGSHLSEVQANGLGASELLRRPLDIHELKACLRRYAMRGSAQFDLEALEREPGGPSIAAAALELDRMFTGLSSGRTMDLASVQQAGDQVIEGIRDVGLATWLDVVRNYHEGTFQHCLIVTGVLSAFGHKNGMRKADVLILTVAGLIHDIGKVRVPIAILDKPGPLTEEEFALMKQHPSVGYEYVRSQNVVSAETLMAIRHHHEYLDGSGYPDGLSAQEIDDLTRITTVCDVYGAMMERRAYKAPVSPQAAMNILTGMAKDGKVEYDLVRALGHCVSA
jgi:putative nucleotidyltransferase with HDIG domain